MMSWTELAVTPHHRADRQTHLIAILARTVMSDLYCVCDISDSPCSIQWCQSGPYQQQEYYPWASCTRRHHQHLGYFVFCLHPWCQKLSLTCHHQWPLCPVQSHPSCHNLESDCSLLLFFPVQGDQCQYNYFKKKSLCLWQLRGSLWSMCLLVITGVGAVTLALHAFMARLPGDLPAKGDSTIALV